MTGFSPFLAEHRFGYGQSADIPPPSSISEMLASLEGRDRAQAQFPIPKFRHLQDAFVLRRRFGRFARDNPDSAEGKAALKKSKDVLRSLRRERSTWFAQLQLRRISGNQGFRERLVTFWGDHFTAFGKNNILALATPAYLEEAVRPHLNGHFADLLTACITEPLMLHYLDQSASVGPNSIAAKRRPGRLGLNENLAREVLELHTLGVNGPYVQRDVHELAKLLTGLSATRNFGFKFRSKFVEPGAEIVLGERYGPEASIAPIRKVLQDLALHPETAAHIARKLAVHFVSDTPSSAIVDHIKTAYLKSDGALSACYAALLEHPDAWALPATNMRPPDEFVSASLRVLGVTPAMLHDLTHKQTRRLFFRPLSLMGQPWLRPEGPDGFDEEDAAWVTPQGISARLDWAMNAPARLLEELPDPASLLNLGVGSDAPQSLSFAANSAENRAVAVGLVLCSPAFQRR